MKKIENKIFEFIDKHKFIIFFIIITLITVAVRFFLLKYKSRDYSIFLEKWFKEVKEYGGFKALNRDIGNYNPPYITIIAFLTYLPIRPLYSIKAVSILFDYILALGVVRIIYIVFEDNQHKRIIALIFYGIVLMYPTVLLNSACWGQADSIYTAFIIWSIAFLMQEKFLKSFILLGIAFAFKLQFIFILPLYILVYISKRKFSIIYFFIIPIVNFVLCMPAIIMGRTVISCMNVYITQTGTNNNVLSLNFPNLYNLLAPIKGLNYVYQPFAGIDKVAIFSVIFIFAIIALLVIYNKIEFEKKKIIEFGLLSVLLSTFVLPHMHDRYLYLGDILALIYFLQNKKKWYIPFTIEMISLYTYCTYLTRNNYMPIQFYSFAFLVILIIVLKDIYIKYLSIDKKMEVEKKTDEKING